MPLLFLLFSPLLLFLPQLLLPFALLLEEVNNWVVHLFLFLAGGGVAGGEGVAGQAEVEPAEEAEVVATASSVWPDPDGCVS